MLRLNLTHNEINNIDTLADTLKINNISLKELFLNVIKIKNINVLYNTLKLNNSIRYLNLNFNFLNYKNNEIYKIIELAEEKRILLKILLVIYMF